MEPLTRAERVEALVAAGGGLALAAYVTAGSPVVGLIPGVVVVASVAWSAPAGDRLHVGVGGLATVTLVGAGVPALAFDTDLGVGFDGTARLWVAVAASLAVLWLCLAALDRRLGDP